MRRRAAAIVYLTLLHHWVVPAFSMLEVGHYDKACPRAENIVRAEVEKRFFLDRTIAPALLRMLFHDSFVRGTDASILLNSTSWNETEKLALPNLTIRGFDLIDNIKQALESVCPGVVSCADIIVLAVRDSVALAGGPAYAVPTGRLDGKVSVKAEALTLPSPSFPVEQSLESFRQKGLTMEDMVALLGAHTVGVALCGFFNDRLFNFHGTGAADPAMNPALVGQLTAVCPNPFFTESNADPAVNLDQRTPAKFDSAYFSEILAGNGVLQIDQEIVDDPTAAILVRNFTSPAAFFPAFVRSIIKMGNIGVIVAPNPLGEIRRKCSAVNSPGLSAVKAPPVHAKVPSVGSTSPRPPTTKPHSGAVHAPTSKSPSAASPHRRPSTKPPSLSKPPSSGASPKPPGGPQVT